MTLLDDLNDLARRRNDPDLYDLIIRWSTPLTETQTSTLTRLAEGWTWQDIAEQDGLNRNGINYRVLHIHRAYSVRSTTRAAVEALRAGHIDVRDLKGVWAGSAPTATQRRLLQAVADYGTNKEAAQALGRTEAAVKGALQALSLEAGTGSRVQIVVRAYREGWIK